MQDARELEQLIRSVVERVVSSLPADAAAKAAPSEVPAPTAPPERRVALGADHGGYPLKEELKAFLEKEGWSVADVGTYSTEAVDYPEFAARVALLVAKRECAFGVMIDGAGIGSSMAANKIPGARAALCYDLSTARNAREHNDANVLTLGAGLIGPALAKDIVKTFLAGACVEERHRRRVALIDALDRPSVRQA